MSNDAVNATHSTTGMLCTYCDEVAETDDHVPPKLLFPPPRAAMVTVRACNRCNKEFGRDDEYARLVLSADHRTGEHPAIDELWPSVLKSLQRAKAPRFRNLLFGTLKPTLFQQQNGLVVPTGVFEADLARLKRWTNRIACGLYRHISKERLPLDADVRSIWEEDLRDMPKATREQFGNGVIRPVLAQPEQVIQAGIFRYRLQLAEQDRYSGAMLMQFYEELFVLVLFRSAELRNVANNQSNVA